MDRTSALVREEAESIARSLDGLPDVLDRLRADAESYFGRGRRMAGSALRELANGFHDTVMADLRPIRSGVAFRPPTPVHPKGETFELCYLVVVPEARSHEGMGTFFRLYSLQVVAGRKRVVVETTPTAMGLTEHAARRFVGRGADVTNALRNLAGILADWAALPGIAEDALLTAGFDRLSMPGMHGMLLGRVDPSASIPPGWRLTLGNGFSRGEPMAADPLLPFTYFGNTFIGRAEIRPNQVGAMSLLEGWRRSCAGAFDAACERVFWPRPTLHASSQQSLPWEKVREVQELILEDRMLRAMGNKPWYETPIRDFDERDDCAPTGDWSEAEEGPSRERPGLGPVAF